MEIVKILNVEIDNLSEAEVLQKLDNLLNYTSKVNRKQKIPGNDVYREVVLLSFSII